MRTPALLLAAALAAAAGPARATDLGLRLDLGYDRVDLFTPDRDHGQRLDFDATVFGGGSLVAPGTIDWGLSAGWHGLRSTAIGGRALDEDRLTFRGRLGFLQRPSSPFTLVLHGDRTRSDFTTESGLARATGTITTTTWGADAYYRAPDRPSLRLGVTRLTSDDSGLGRAPSERNSWRLRGGVTQGTGGYSFSADYDGELADGTFDSDNFDAHTVTVNASASIAPSLDARLTERYYLRSPTRTSPFNPRYEDNHLFGSVNWVGTGALSRTAYGYGHTLITAPATADRERVQNALSQAYEHQLTPELRLIGLLDLTAAEERLAGATTRSSSEGATLLGRWMRRAGEVDLFAQGGGTAGLFQADGGDGRTAWGLQGEVGVGGPLAGTRAGARYSASFQENQGGVGGWSLRQSLSGEVEARPAPDLQWRGSLRFTADRIQSDVFGGGANRLIQLLSNARWRLLQVDLQAGISSGVLGAPGSGVHGDGLFVPAPFNTHSSFATLSASVEPISGLTFRGQTRYLDLRLPDRDRQYEIGVLGGVTYRLGALLVSVEDEYVSGGGAASRGTQNRLLLRLARFFGTRF